MEHLHGSYSLPLVFLSFIIATATSYSALDLAGRIQAGKGKIKIVWLLCGAFSMGIGIWSMHFVGMLAFSFPIPVFYHIGTVILSIIFAIIASAIALSIVGLHKENRSGRLFASGLLMAAAISGMHYVGMAAMSLEISYDWGIVMLSVAIAALASFAALWLLLKLRDTQSPYAVWFKVGSGMIMAVAITGMHYTGMAAASFNVSNSVELNSGLLQPQGIAYGIGAATLLTLTITILTSLLNKRLSDKDFDIERHERWYRSLYDHNIDGIISVSHEGKILHVNPAVEKITGMNTAHFLQQPVTEIGLIEGCSDKEFQQFKRKNYDTVYIRPDGAKIDLNLMHVPVIINRKVAGTHIMMRDITLEKQTKKQIQHLAYHDELTGLPNRRRFNHLIEKAVQDSNQTGDPFVVLALDIDRFKMINDSLGHMYGDLFLQKVSKRISNQIKNDDAILARLGGDEFVIVYKNYLDIKTVESFAEQILTLIQKPFHLKEHDFYISASIGIAIYPEHGEAAGELIKHADTAMYEVKKNFKNGYQFYTKSLNEHLEEKLELESELRRGIANNELVLHYQPKFSVDGEVVLGMEALVRWQHPQRGLIPPGLFLPIAEETGLIFDIGTWVLKKACSQMKTWQDKGGLQIPIAVNLSSQQFHQLNFEQHIQSILVDTGLEPKFLELEITESMMMDAKTSTLTLQKLSNLGVKISLDDFGTGYSSLSYLKQFPINRLKIDRSFIMDITNNEHDKAIVSTIISMAKHLNMEVTAEGIETKDQLDFLLPNKSMEIQGYYFSKPLTAEDVEIHYMRRAVLE
ncbi:bifunctional diguanylate cyclase/phosphodiesterase [Alkalicoccobacillus murimartini]|uniref:Diguanylate cyclase (GGDEF)-like protein/PAS domain S-box-containing protein n=1 Tax=Alkalicoccobacillus murimartini TaxID=171685 RepID=A0ABT9YH51_9BACI|nr:EAL domain-containing protein [Alkalicoccobacillus murimartini]MDQ0207167.1 diguanylate cyclase (GGDEF)-like protein/PAS domain S-box-containing protein [Alkalicoccobacillus murimartini]